MSPAENLSPNAPAKRLLVDCDPGVDDAVALALAFASPELEVLAVTTVAGNVSVDVSTKNARRLLGLLGRGDIPLAAGAREPLVREPPPCPPIHGVNGLGGVELEASFEEPMRPEHAVDLIAENLRQADPGSVTFAALAPLTNLALVLALHPELAERIDRVYLMGGSTGRGNITPVAEFNARADPEAAQRVLGAPVVDVIMFGLNVTSLATLGRPGLDRMRECSDAGARLAEIVSGYRDIGTDGWRLHDVAVIASIIDPSLFEAQPAMVEVDTGAGPGRGQTVCAFTDSPALDARAEAKEPEIQVAVGFDGDRFRSLLLERLATAP